MQKLKVH